MIRYTKEFKCITCNNQDFSKVHNFSVEFRSVNFSDNILSEKKSNVKYRCRECGRTYTSDFIMNHLNDMIIKYKDDEWGEEE